jgi:hypothetical protein
MKATQKIKTIDINAKQWFDKINGNSYFSAIIMLNFGLKNEKSINVPFQYGYGDSYIDTALHQLKTENYFSVNVNSLWKHCNENNIILRTSKKENCLKSEVKNFVNY